MNGTKYKIDHGATAHFCANGSHLFIYINIYSYIRKKWINGYGWHKMQDCPWGRRAVPEGEGNTDELGHDSIF